MIARTPRPSSPISVAVGAVELDLGGRVGAVAELGLQTVEAQGVRRAVLVAARDEQQREPCRGLGQHEERVGLRGRDEPLRARDRPGAVRAGDGDGPARPHVGAAGALGQGHADQRAALLAGGQRPRVVLAARGELLPALLARPEPQRRHAGVGHRERARDPRFDLGQHDEARRAGDVRAGPGVGPRRSGHAARRPRGPSASARRGGRRSRRRAHPSGPRGPALAAGRSPGSPTRSPRARRAARRARGRPARIPRRPRGAAPRAARRRRPAGCRRSAPAAAGRCAGGRRTGASSSAHQTRRNPRGQAALAPKEGGSAGSSLFRGMPDRLAGSSVAQCAQRTPGNVSTPS